MTDLLRGKLGFQGLIVTDALDMNGVLGKMTMAEVTQRAVLAGNDVLLMPTDIAGAIDAVVDGVRRGLFPNRASPNRFASCSSPSRRWDSRASGSPIVQALRSVVGGQREPRGRTARRRARDHAREGLARRRARSVGMPRTSRVVSVTIAPRTDLGAGATFNAELARDVSVAALPQPHHGAGLRRDRRGGRARPDRTGASVPRQRRSRGSCPHSSRMRCAARRARIW